MQLVWFSLALPTTFVQATFVLGTFVNISNIGISKLNTFDFSLVLFIAKLSSSSVQCQLN